MHVKILRQSKTATQSGLAKTEGWLLEYELESARHPESLMGWISSEDTLNQVKLKFPMLEEAKAYAERQGWTYTVYPAHERRVRPRNYGDNFKYRKPGEEGARG